MMRPDNRIPLATLIMLGIFVTLSMFLAFLILMRNADIPGRVTTKMREIFQQISARRTDVVFETDTPWLEAILLTDIRSGPGDEYTRLAILEPGNRMKVIGNDADRGWYQIEVPYLKEGQGWVAARNVKGENLESAPAVSFTPMLPSSPTLIPTMTRVPAMVIALVNLNVRSGPGLNFKKVGVLKAGETAEAVGTDEEGFWYVIVWPEAPEGLGWVSKDYVTAQRAVDLPIIPVPIPEGQVLVPTPAAGLPMLTAKFKVNIRSGPGQRYDILGTLEGGQRAEVIGISQDGEWYAIRLLGESVSRGWVAATYVVVENAEGLPVIQD